MKPRVYLETTIVSYLVSRPSRDLITAAHQQITQEWWDKHLIDFDIYISELVIQEASVGDEQVRSRRINALEGIPVLQTNPEALELAKKLIKSGVIHKKAVGDALHIAIASANGMYYLLTWNLAHLANAARRNDITSVCRSAGYEPPVICTPEELLEG